MRVFLLLVIAVETLFFGLTMGRIADHYQYLEEACMYNFYHMEVPDKNGQCILPRGKHGQRQTYPGSEPNGH